MTATTTWRKIPGFSDYEASIGGVVRNKHTQHVLKASKYRGWERISIKDDGGSKKAMRVHRVIARTFVPNPASKPTVNHRNHDRGDNRVENLEWATVAEQNRHRKKTSRQKQRLMSSRKVWRLDMQTGKRMQLFETGRDAAKWIFDNKLTTVVNFANGNNIKTKICAVCQKRTDKSNGGYTRKSAYGFRWEYDDAGDVIEGEIWRPLRPDIINGTSLAWAAFAIIMAR
jgi:hypothetical protein